MKEEDVTLAHTGWPQPKYLVLGVHNRALALADTTTPRPDCRYCGKRTNEHLVMCEDCGRKMDKGLPHASDTIRRREAKNY